MIYSPPSEGVYVNGYIEEKKMIFDEILEFDIYNLFADRDSGEVHISLVNNSNPEVVSCAVIDSILIPKLILTAGIVQGTSTITLKGRAGEFSETFEFDVKVFDPARYNIEDFETGNFTKYPWEFGSYDWFIDSVEPQEGTYCIQSSDIMGNQIAEIFIEMNYETDGNIAFWYKVSSEEDFDYLEFWIDRVKKVRISGDTPWRETSFSVPAGIHTLKWRYEKDVSGNSGDDCAWIDRIIFEGGISTSIDNEQFTIDNSALYQNYPNPFNPSTEISFSLDESQVVKLSVYNLSGQLVSELVNRKLDKGLHKINFNANELNSGIYFYELECEGFTKTNKMLLIK